jgi:hypothetical protein
MRELRLVAGAVLVLSAAATAAAQPTAVVVDPYATVRGTPVVAVGTDGLPVVAYQDRTALRIARCADAACSSATLTVVDGSVLNTDGLLAFTIPPDGRGLFVYWTAQFDRLMTARCADAACTSASTAMLEQGVALRGRPSVAIGSDGLPLVAWVAGTSPPYAVRAAHCADAACASAAIATVATVYPQNLNRPSDTDLAIGTDGLGLIAYAGSVDFVSRAFVAHCSDAACSAATTAVAPDTLLFKVERPSIEIGADGRGLLSYRPFNGVPPAPPLLPEVQVQRCADTACTSLAPAEGLPTTHEGEPAGLGMAAVPGGWPWIAHARYAGQVVATCNDDTCAAYTETCLVGRADRLSVARGGDGLPVTAFVSEAAQPPGPAFPIGARPLRVGHGFTGCATALADVDDPVVDEGGTARFTVRFSRPLPAPGSVSVRTRDRNAVGGLDYVAVPPTVVALDAGAQSFTVDVEVIEDGVYETWEEFELVLSAPVGFAIQDDAGLATVVDDEAPPAARIGDCRTVEGDAGQTDCAFEVTLDGPAGEGVPIQMQYATLDDTATAGADYLAASGSLTFAPGQLSKTITVAVVGDVAVELDERYFVRLSGAVNVSIGDFEGEGVIADDDAPPLGSLELTHGSSLYADLEGGGGPSAEADFFRLAQAPYSSYEVVVDAAAGQLVPGLALHRLAEDNSTVRQTATPVGTGSAVAMSWIRASGLPEIRESLRLFSPACTGGCGPQDVYRIRLYDTTARLARFNNSDTQVTVVLLQNPGDREIAARLHFWRAAGALAATMPVTVAPRGMAIVNTAAVAGTAGASGSITVAHDGGYGGLAGKAVAVEPATGFVLDTPLQYRPR